MGEEIERKESLVVRQPSSTTNSRSDTAAELRNGSCLPLPPSALSAIERKLSDLRDWIPKLWKDRHRRESHSPGDVTQASRFQAQPLPCFYGAPCALLSWWHWLEVP